MLRIIIQGCKAGTFSGLLWGGLILLFISPLILEAEKYESGAQEEVSHDMILEHAHHEGHHHEHQGATDREFEPNQWQRPLLTLTGSTLLGLCIGIMASILLGTGASWGIVELEKLKASPWLSGLIVGLLGLLVFQGIPSLGLPPELPGVIGAEHDFSARQEWWILSVFFSTLALLSFAGLPLLLQKIFYKDPSRKLWPLTAAVSALLIGIPFIIGVPAHAVTTTAPVELATRFHFLSLSVNAGFWLLLGGSFFHLLKEV